MTDNLYPINPTFDQIVADVKSKYKQIYEYLSTNPRINEKFNIEFDILGIDDLVDGLFPKPICLYLKSNNNIGVMITHTVSMSFTKNCNTFIIKNGSLVDISVYNWLDFTKNDLIDYILSIEVDNIDSIIKNFIPVYTQSKSDEIRDGSIV